MTGPQMVVKQLLNWLGCTIDPAEVDRLFDVIKTQIPEALAALQTLRRNFDLLVTGVAATEASVAKLQAEVGALRAILTEHVLRERQSHGRRTDSDRSTDSTGTGTWDGGAGSNPAILIDGR